MSYLATTAMCLVGYVGAYIAGIFINSVVKQREQKEFPVLGTIGLIVAAGIIWYSFTTGSYVVGAVVWIGIIVGYIS